MRAVHREIRFSLVEIHYPDPSPVKESRTRKTHDRQGMWGMADGPAREAIPTSIDQGLLLGERERLSCGEASNAWTKNIISRKIESDIADPPLPGRIIPSRLMYRLGVVIPGGRALILSRHPEARSLG
jgi:hypothetical protein